MEKSRVCSFCKIKKELTLFYKSKQGKFGRESRCKECTKRAKRLFYKNNSDMLINRVKEYAKNNPNVSRRANSKWRKRNKSKQAELTKNWSEKNRGRRNASTAKRRSIKLNATPKWSDLDKITIVYKKAKWLENLTGLKYHVDHIIPLQGENVCGLHVWDNLQILEASINISKGNKNE